MHAAWKASAYAQQTARSAQIKIVHAALDLPLLETPKERSCPRNDRNPGNVGVILASAPASAGGLHALRDGSALTLPNIRATGL